jgi:hypothetical protein
VRGKPGTLMLHPISARSRNPGRTCTNVQGAFWLRAERQRPSRDSVRASFKEELIYWGAYAPLAIISVVHRHSSDSGGM